MTVVLRALPLLAIALAVGCSRDTGVLTGTVTFDGKIVTSGMVAVKSEDGRNASANIQDNGTYRIEDAPVGTNIEISVKTFPPAPVILPPGVKADPAQISVPPAYVAVPDRYGEFATSKLTTIVNPGETKRDLNLEK